MNCGVDEPTLALDLYLDFCVTSLAAHQRTPMQLGLLEIYGERVENLEPLLNRWIDKNS